MDNFLDRRIENTEAESVEDMMLPNSIDSKKLKVIAVKR